MKKVIKETKREKKVISKKNKTIIALTILTIGNIFALSSVSFAWFVSNNKSSSTIETFSGDLEVSINKVSALKYVYPFHNNSAEFVDYLGVGTVKNYVVQDVSIEEPTNISESVTIPLGRISNQTYASSDSDPNISSSKIHFETSQDFKYYLLGDSVFNGVSENPWSTLSATTFSRREVPIASDNPTDDQTTIVTNVVVSSGAEFIFFDAHTINVGGVGKCEYFSYDTPIPEAGKQSIFTVTDGHLKCLKSGIYTFQYWIDASDNEYLNITLTSRSDDAIIGFNIIDPTMISIDYRGSVDKEEYPEIQDYLPIAIYNQKTMVVLDVEIEYQNKHDIDASLKIMRNPNTADSYDQSIYALGGYNTTNAYTYRGYVDDSHRNPLNASDFYSFRSVIAKEENAYASPAAAWNDLHSVLTDDGAPLTPAYKKFSSTIYDTEFVSLLEPKELDDSSIIPGSLTESTYHIYIAIDYDYEYTNFFLDQNRLGKTYLLDRDFGFYFAATQHLEEGPSPAIMIGGDGD